MPTSIPVYLTDKDISEVSFDEPNVLVITPRGQPVDDTGCQLMVNVYLVNRQYSPQQNYGKLLTNQGRVTDDVIRTICNDSLKLINDAFPDGAYLFAHHRHFRPAMLDASVGPEAVDDMMLRLHHVALLNDQELQHISDLIQQSHTVCSLEAFYKGFSLDNVRRHYHDDPMRLSLRRVDHFGSATQGQRALTAEQIRQICRAWQQSTVQSDGSLHIRPGQNRLVSYNIGFHLLDFDALCTALIETAIVSIHQNLVVIQERDHIWLLSWCGEVLQNRIRPFFPVVDGTGYKGLVEACLHGILVETNPAIGSRDDIEDWDRFKAAMPLHMRGLFNSSNTVSGYLVFPLLEATIKRACSDYIDLSGNVLREFTVIDEDRKETYYGPRGSSNPNGNRRKRKCSSLEDLMRLHYQIADADLKAYLDPLYEHLKNVFTIPDETPSAYATIYEWRCSSLHGGQGYSLVANTLLNLSMLIALWPVKDAYDSIRPALVHRASEIANFSPRPPHSFYPPY